MKKNLFELGTQWDNDWVSDNKEKTKNIKEEEYKTPAQHRLYFVKEKRRGKVVTIVKPFALDQNQLQDLLKILKKKFGCGGTVKENSLEFQGDIQNKLLQYLKKTGYQFKS